MTPSPVIRVIRVPRIVLAAPFELLRFVAVAVAYGLRYLAELVHRGCHGTWRHIYYPLTVAARWVRGEPTWKPIDFTVGVRPRTDAHRDAAFAEGWRREVCHCGQPRCSGETWTRTGHEPAAEAFALSTGLRADDIQLGMDSAVEIKNAIFSSFTQDELAALDAFARAPLPHRLAVVVALKPAIMAAIAKPQS